MSADQRRTKVNGKYLRHYAGKNVSILGNVLKVNESASTFEMKSTDNSIVNVIMNEPFEDYPKDWVEVWGVAQGRSNVLCEQVISLPNSMMEDFNAQMFDDMITVINTFDNPWVNSKE